MTIWALIGIISGITVVTSVFITIILKRGKSAKHEEPAPADTLADETESVVENIFDDDFREELRNRGRLHFEKIISENAMFLQQDLRLTTSQLNEYMKTEITRTLQDEFSKYEESITDAKQMAIDSINKTQTAIEEQRQAMSQQITQEVAAEKERLLHRFQQNMTDIVNHYVLAAIGNQIDLSDQLEYILADIETNKDAIIRDISDGA